MKTTNVSRASRRLTTGGIPTRHYVIPARFPVVRPGNRSQMRLMFWTYVLVIAGGLASAFLVGLTHN